MLITLPLFTQSCCSFPFQFHVLYFVSFAVIIIGVIIYSVKPPPNAPQQGDYREMRPTDDPEPVPPALGSHTGVAYHTQRHNSANHSAESAPIDQETAITDNHNYTAVPKDNHNTDERPKPIDRKHPKPPERKNKTPTDRKHFNNAHPPPPPAHTEEYTRLPIGQDDDR